MKINHRTLSAPTQEKLKRAATALEDLLFALRQARAENLELAVDALHMLVDQSTGGVGSSAVARSYQSPDPNKHFLIGALPRLLLDKDLFPSNEDIVDFASAALRIELKGEKRARFEIIGKVVCETDSLDEQHLTNIVRALERLVGNKEQLAIMIERKRTGSFSWNKTLQELLHI